MAGRQKAAKAEKKPAPKRAAKRSPTPKAAPEPLRSVRDPERGPSNFGFEKSLNKGSSISLNDFRSIIKWK
jgi:hypothetical protein